MDSNLLPSGIMFTQEDIRQFGAVLWFKLGRVLDIEEVRIATKIKDPNVLDELVAKMKERKILTDYNIVQPVPLANWLLSLLNAENEEMQKKKMLWTLPKSHPLASDYGQSYYNKISEMIALASDEVFIVSPFMHDSGFRKILQCISEALYRAVNVIIVTHAAQNLGSSQSRAIEKIRHEAELTKGSLSVFTANVPKGVTLHSKLIIVDRRQVILGSANLTGPGLEENFETGTLLGVQEAQEALEVLESLIRSDLVRKVFSTKSNSSSGSDS